MTYKEHILEAILDSWKNKKRISIKQVLEELNSKIQELDQKLKESDEDDLELDDLDSKLFGMIDATDVENHKNELEELTFDEICDAILEDVIKGLLKLHSFQDIPWVL